MNKETWIKHIEETSHIIRPSISGEREAWKSFLDIHSGTCSLCKARRKTRNQNKYNREKNQVLRDLCGTSASAARRDMGM